MAVTTRLSIDTKENPDVVELRATAGETNSAWLRRAKATRGILLVGGASLTDFRLRVAQSHLRRDLMPSFWSFAGWYDGKDSFDSVTLSWPDASAIRQCNGVQTLPIAAIDDPSWFPNIAVLRFTRPAASLGDEVDRVKRDRSVIDLPSLILPWLGFVWGTSQYANPLLSGMGVPSGAFVEAIHALAGVELTPGLSSSASCPEAIWVAAKWWRSYYEKGAKRAATNQARARTPSGVYTTRQRSAFVHDPNDPHESAAGARKRTSGYRHRARAGV